MDKFSTWYKANDTAITWFIIGMLFNNTLFHLAHDQPVLAFTDVVLAGINFYFWRNNRV
jgi:hypothetical protein